MNSKEIIYYFSILVIIEKGLLTLFISVSHFFYRLVTY